MTIQKAAVAAAAVLLSGLVYAGLVQPAPVMVTIEADGSGFAQGDMVTARFSANDIEFIGCGIRNISDGAGGVIEFGFCQARMDDGTEEGLRGVCNTTDAGLLDALKATSDFSFITYSWNDLGECTRIGASTQSFYIPEFKLK